jgi:hypothetical protein
MIPSYSKTGCADIVRATASRKESGWQCDKEHLTVKTGPLGRELSQNAKRELHKSARPAFQCLRKSPRWTLERELSTRAPV